MKPEEVITIAPRLLLQVSLMIFFSCKKLSCLEEVSEDHMTFKSFNFALHDFLLNPFLYFVCDYLLFLSVAKDWGSILSALVVNLSILLSRVMESKKEFDQFFVMNFWLIIQNKYHFDMTCVSFAYFLVWWIIAIYGVWIHETYWRPYNRFWEFSSEVLGKKLFCTPVTSSSKTGNHEIFWSIYQVDPFVRVSGIITYFPLFNLILLAVHLLENKLHKLFVHLKLFWFHWCTGFFFWVFLVFDWFIQKQIYI